VFNEDYVREIQLARDDFYKLCRPDMTAGFQPEVDEAARRYFTKKRIPVHG
jgi:hypothetical protein